MRTQQQEIVASSEPGFMENAPPAFSGGSREAGLHGPNLPGDRAETSGYGRAAHLIPDNVLGSLHHGVVRSLAISHNFLPAVTHRLPKYGCEQESRGDRFRIPHPFVGILQSLIQ